VEGSGPERGWRAVSHLYSSIGRFADRHIRRNVSIFVLDIVRFFVVIYGIQSGSRARPGMGN
jgi:hypothetical protein